MDMNAAWPKFAARGLPEQVAEAILGRVTSGDLKPGSRLPAQRELAEAMGVGLAVVREAVKRLEALNVVEATQGSGTIIRPIRWVPLMYDPNLFPLAVQRIGVRDLWEVRSMLEAQGIRLAVQRATEDDLEAMRAVLKSADPLPLEYETSQSLNREFHLALARATQNVMLESILAPLLNVHVPGAERHFTHDHCRETWAAHQQIYDAVARRDLKAADRAIIVHFQVGPLLPEAIVTALPMATASAVAKRSTTVKARSRQGGQP